MCGQPWIEVDRTSSLELLTLFSWHHTNLGGGTKNVGEAFTLAFAEFRGIVAVVDDRAARASAKAKGVSFTGTLEPLVQGIRDGRLSRGQACRVIDVLREHEAYLPCDGDTFLARGVAHGHLDP